MSATRYLCATLLSEIKSEFLEKVNALFYVEQSKFFRSLPRELFPSGNDDVAIMLVEFHHPAFA